MRGLRASLLVAAALVAAVQADFISSSVLEGSAGSLSGESEATSSPTTAPTATTVIGVNTESSSLASSSDKETTEAPEADGSSSSHSSISPATVVPSSALSKSSSASGGGDDPPASTSTPATASPNPTIPPPASSSDSVGTLTDQTSTISNASNAGLSTNGVIGVVFGALACVGAVVLIVTYKKRNDGDSDSPQGPPSSCAYADGTFFTPDSRSLDAILDLEKPSSSDDREEQRQQHQGEKMVPVLSMADLTGSSGARESSPFGSTSKAVRVSSPVRQYSSNCSEDDTVFATSGSRQHDGSNVVLTFADMERASSASTVAAIEDGRGQVLL